MPGRSTPLVNDHLYHVFHRSIDLKPVFANKVNCKRFVTLLDYYRFANCPLSFSKLKMLNKKARSEIIAELKRDGAPLVEIICFCLMPNHFHFLLRQIKKQGISRFLSNLQNSYTKYYNAKNQRGGTLFQGSFKTVLVETEEQLIHLSRYIHLNPYSGTIVGTLKSLLNYPWSSLPQYLKQQAGFCQTETILSLFPKPGQYKKFLADRADYQKSLQKTKHLIIEANPEVTI